MKNVWVESGGLKQFSVELKKLLLQTFGKTRLLDLSKEEFYSIDDKVQEIWDQCGQPSMAKYLDLYEESS